MDRNMRVITVNTNGIRAAERKGIFIWLAEQNADVICIQETKAQEHQLSDDIYYLSKYHRFFFDAEKKGYSGVALYTRQKPDAVHRGLGFALADREGRYIQADFGNLSVASLYLPSGSSGDERQEQKFTFLNEYMPILQRQRLDGRSYILCGDWNIAHKPIDLKNWKSNQKTSGFLPEERAWLDELFNTVGYVDAFRIMNQEPDQYTWWSQRFRAFDKNVGWRIDYHIVSPDLKEKIIYAAIYRDQQFSDHAPLTIDYQI